MAASPVREYATCFRCQEWERRVSDLWWRTISQATKVKALVNCALPYVFSPLREQLGQATQGLLRTLGNLDNVGARIHNLTTQCPHRISLTSAQKATIESQRQDLLIGAQQRLAFLDDFLPNLERGVEQTVAMGQEIGMGMYKSAQAYVDMMNDSLNRWRESSLQINQQWETLWNELRARQQVLDRKEVLTFAGVPYVDVFWKL